MRRYPPSPNRRGDGDDAGRGDRPSLHRTARRLMIWLGPRAALRLQCESTRHAEARCAPVSGFIEHLSPALAEDQLCTRHADIRGSWKPCPAMIASKCHVGRDRRQPTWEEMLAVAQSTAPTFLLTSPESRSDHCRFASDLGGTGQGTVRAGPQLPEPLILHHPQRLSARSKPHQAVKVCRLRLTCGTVAILSSG